MIRIETTPNPNAIKCVVGRAVTEKTRSYRSAEQAADDPVAARLFAIEGVSGVMFCQDFVTVNKVPGKSWLAIRRRVVKILENIDLS